uniref:Uncharacterized protein n=1 Tax=Onchocerca volvulus TaxID=6282 RepID=A0A8R1XKW1_ONCVO
MSEGKLMQRRKKSKFHGKFLAALDKKMDHTKDFQPGKIMFAKLFRDTKNKNMKMAIDSDI